ncbi:hypothetical protein [Vibrio splendidus]|uniref:hypothetical protein n=1 Tax=Vibrio splendidus TaxID=29497 RepID=UPI000D3C05B9|nr:hypothetical protein [Vibrio splendidus]PTP45915.1 hypothetical protein CWN87_02065 [Vibrio splendidus]
MKEQEQPVSSIPDALEKHVYVDVKPNDVQPDIEFVGTITDMLKKYGTAEQSKERNKWKS